MRLLTLIIIGVLALAASSGCKRSGSGSDPDTGGPPGGQFSQRGTPAEREELLATAIRETVQYSFNYTAESEEVVSLVHQLLEENQPVEISKIDMGKRVPQAAQAVAKKYPNASFFFQVPTAEKDTPFKAVTNRLGKEDRTETGLIQIGGINEPLTWHFFGWCGFGVAQDGKVYGLKVECKDVPVE